jgi:hypothetical protein
MEFYGVHSPLERRLSIFAFKKRLSIPQKKERKLSICVGALGHPDARNERPRGHICDGPHFNGPIFFKKERDSSWLWAEPRHIMIDVFVVNLNR